MLRRLFKYVVRGCVRLLALISTSTGVLAFLSGIFTIAGLISQAAKYHSLTVKGNRFGLLATSAKN